VTSLLLGEGLPRVTGLPDQGNPNEPADPEVQRQINRAAIQARRPALPRAPARGCGRGHAARPAAARPMGYRVRVRDRVYTHSPNPIEWAGTGMR